MARHVASSIHPVVGTHLFLACSGGVVSEAIKVILNPFTGRPTDTFMNSLSAKLSSEPRDAKRHLFVLQCSNLSG